MNRRRFMRAALVPPFAFALTGHGLAETSSDRQAAAEHSPGNREGRPAIVAPDKQFMDSLPRLMELAQLPGIGAGVVHGDQLVWQHYAGVANAKTKVPITADSIFPAASMGKPVFAFAVLQLVDEGKLDLDRPLQNYLKEGAPTGEWGARITARHILSHSSGLMNWRWEHDQALTPAFEPGTAFRYSGEGFYYLQRCVERITNTGIEQFMQERMMKPLGMSSSTYLWRQDVATRLVEGHRGAEPFDNREFAVKVYELIQKSGAPLGTWNSDKIVEEMTKGGTSPHAPMPSDTSPNVAFSMLTTVRDYCAFLSRVISPNADAFSLKVETRVDMMHPYSYVNSALSWGLGWGIEEESGLRYLWQWGDNGGWKNIVMAHPESRSALVVFTNGENGMRVVERVTRAATGQEQPLFLWV